MRNVEHQDGRSQDGMPRDGMPRNGVANHQIPRQETLAAEPLPADTQDFGTPVDDRPAESLPVADRPADSLPVDETGPAAGDAAVTGGDLFPGDAATRLRERWRELQADFVDDPQRAVREADDVVDEVLRTITEHRQRLAGEWQGDTDTEHLRLAMREYRTFVDRLLPTT
ncbi:hypothetical protein [Actinophytocola glycyrrhizae]|uniref:Uncharacterized protein n=1 Tax=Actinophytocola glycyrrhizae TaxID=2044873 RepID=A0ABV9S1C3_9PSEU